MSIHRLLTLLTKEFMELRRNPASLLPVVILVAVALIVPFLIAFVIPALTDQTLADDGDVRNAIEAASELSQALRALDAEAAVQTFLYQQFLLIFLLIPITGAMSLAAYSVIGEKQGRSLEPLLATPITTFELLGAKVLASLLPALAAEAGAVVLYFLGIWLLAAPGVLAVLLSFRTFLLVAVLGPLAALLALQLAVTVSSRVNDPRSAQQIGVLVILPVVGVMVAQFAGAFWLTTPIILLAAAGLLAVWVGLAWLGVVLFEREVILTKWK